MGRLIDIHMPAPATGDNAELPEFSIFSDSGNVQSDTVSDNMMECMVKVNRLTDAELDIWLKPNLTTLHAGYHLRDCKKQLSNVRLLRTTKADVNYTFSSGSSQDEGDDDFTVRPGKWNRKQAHNIYVPASGPLADHIAAQQHIRQQKEAVAVEVLLHLPQIQPNSIGDNNNKNNMSSSSSSSSGKSTVADHATVEPQMPSNATTLHSTTTGTDDTLEANMPLSKLKEQDEDNMPLSKLKEKEEDDLPLSVLKERLILGKPYFKTKSFELYRYK